jgi:probable rRNA maturation factor
MSNYSISIADRQRTVRIDRRAMIALTRATLATEQVAAAEISIAFVGDAEIHEINRTFLNHDCPTDVISFLLEGAEFSLAGAPGAIRRGAERNLDGEVVISTDTAVKNAACHATRAEYELALYLVHGLLHLCGYDDLTAKEKRLMRRREAEILQHYSGLLPQDTSATSASNDRTRSKP